MEFLILDTLSLIKELTEENERLRAKQTPQKPLNTRREIICPSCRTLVGSRPYCGYCGQAIDWSKESEVNNNVCKPILVGSIGYSIS